MPLASGMQQKRADYMQVNRIPAISDKFFVKYRDQLVRATALEVAPQSRFQDGTVLTCSYLDESGHMQPREIYVVVYENDSQEYVAYAGDYNAPLRGAPGVGDWFYVSHKGDIVRATVLRVDRSDLQDVVGLTCSCRTAADVEMTELHNIRVAIQPALEGLESYDVISVD